MKVYLEIEEAERMVAAAGNLRDRLLIRLLLRLGCRISEALGLKVDDIDSTRKTVTIKHLKSRLKLSCPDCGKALGVSHAYCPGCGSKVDKAVSRLLEFRRQRTLPIDDGTLGMLTEYTKRGGPIVKNGRRMIFDVNRHRAWQIVKECAEKSGLPELTNPSTGKRHNVSPHSLRTTFAVHAVKMDDSGDGLRLLQEHLGHASFNTTAKYRKVSGREQRGWYDKLWQGKDNE